MGLQAPALIRSLPIDQERVYQLSPPRLVWARNAPSDNHPLALWEW